MRRATLLALALVGCGDRAATPAIDAPPPVDAAPPIDADPARLLIPGERVGPLVLGMTWADVLRAVGAPPTEPVVLVRIGHATWPALGLEALLTSPSEATLTPDAVVIGAGATAGADLAGPVLPGDVRAAVVLALGPAPEAYGGRSYYPSGLAIEWDEADRARRVGVVAPYQLAPDPPPMQPARELP
ncbi:MAG: hypothetical protein JNK64_07305 [Myxococcales bacterium]|nr:hypothetical protein [Myxococcales bacterium]